MIMKYLVLGGNGFIGSYIVDEILQNGHEVGVLDRSQEKYRELLPNVDYFFGGIDDAKLLEQALDKVDILIHSVSTTVPATSNNNIEFDITSNLINSVKIFKIAVEKGIKRIVYLSSGGAIYGNADVVPIPENHPTDPLSSYGIIKLAIEKYLQFFSHNYGIDYNIIRPSNPYGPRQNPFANQGVISVFLGKVVKGEAIEVWGDGSVAKDYIFIKDVATAIYNASVSDKTSEIFNIGSGTYHSLKEIISAIQKVTGLPVEVNYTEGKKFDVQKVCLDISKAKESLDFSPATSVESGISETWEFVKKLKNIT